MSALFHGLSPVLQNLPAIGLLQHGRDLLSWVTEMWGGKRMDKTQTDNDNQATLNPCFLPQNKISKVHSAHDILHVWCTLKGKSILYR